MRILFADTFERSGLDDLTAAGHEVDYRPDLSAEDLAGGLGGADVLVVRSTVVGEAVFAAGGPLGLVIRAGAGTNTIDAEAAARRAVFVANVPGKNAAAVAELTLGLIVALDRRIPDNVIDARAGSWNKRKYAGASGLYGRTLGIVGLGRIGLEVAVRAASFGLRLVTLAKRRDPATRQRMRELEIDAVADLTALAEESDIVTIHLPGGAATRRLVDSEFLAHLRPGAMLVNTSRGDVIDEEALVEAINRQGLRVAIDVFEGEPATGSGTFDSPLARHPAVYTTHHIGASTLQAQEAIAAEVLAMINDYRRGVVRNVVNLTPPRPDGSILVVRHYDRVGVLSSVLEALKQAGLNVQEMGNQVFSGAGAAVASIQVEGGVGDALCEQLAANPDVIQVTVREAPA